MIRRRTFLREGGIVAADALSSAKAAEMTADALSSAKAAEMTADARTSQEAAS
jgi:hypothetical protein